MHVSEELGVVWSLHVGEQLGSVSTASLAFNFLISPKREVPGQEVSLHHPNYTRSVSAFATRSFTRPRSRLLGICTGT